MLPAVVAGDIGAVDIAVPQVYNLACRIYVGSDYGLYCHTHSADNWQIASALGADIPCEAVRRQWPNGQVWANEEGAISNATAAVGAIKAELPHCTDPNVIQWAARHWSNGVRARAAAHRLCDNQDLLRLARDRQSRVRRAARRQLARRGLNSDPAPSKR